MKYLCIKDFYGIKKDTYVTFCYTWFGYEKYQNDESGKDKIYFCFRRNNGDVFNLSKTELEDNFCSLAEIRNEQIDSILN